MGNIYVCLNMDVMSLVLDHNHVNRCAAYSYSKVLCKVHMYLKGQLIIQGLALYNPWHLVSRKGTAY